MKELIFVSIVRPIVFERKRTITDVTPENLWPGRITISTQYQLKRFITPSYLLSTRFVIKNVTATKQVAGGQPWEVSEESATEETLAMG